MYFALIPTKEHTDDLAARVNYSLVEFHLTVLFAQDRTTKINSLDVHALWPTVPDPPRMRVGVVGVASLGPPDKKVWALLLDKPQWLVDLRTRCMGLLRRYGIGWDMTWNFTPHVTISKFPTITLDDHIIENLEFDRLELRY